MTRIIRLTESDLTRIVKRVIKEQRTMPEVTITAKRNPVLQQTAGEPITLPNLYLNVDNKYTALSFSPNGRDKSKWVYTLTSQPKTKTVDIKVTNDSEPTMMVKATYNCESKSMGPTTAVSKVTSMASLLTTPEMARPAKNSVGEPTSIDKYFKYLASGGNGLMDLTNNPSNQELAGISTVIKQYCGI
jgi:hypothetical protein